MPDRNRVWTTDDDDNESEERLMMNRGMFEAPGARHGAAQHKPHKAKVWVAPERNAALPGRSMGAERRDQDRKAAEQMARLDAQLARANEMIAKEKRAKTDPNRKHQKLVDQNLPTGVWQLQSWMDGGKSCPDSQPEWKAV